jgi:CubicO group peptidase (beta-lactamase class C family)
MAHVAGVSTDSGSDGPLFRRRCARPGEALQNFADSDLLFEPGTQFRHSKYGWILVSAAVEAAAGQPFLTVMREQVFQPLGMEATGADSTAEENPDHIGEPAEDAPFLTLIQDFILEPVWGKSLKRSERATFYTLGLGPDPVFRYRLHRMRPHNLSCYAGSMAFLSTPSDLVRFALAITNGNILQPATVQLLQSPRQLRSGQDTGYGLGWDLETVTLNGIPRQAAGHSGELLGRGVMSLMAFREPGIVVAVTSNASYVDTSALAVKIAEVFAGRR